MVRFALLLTFIITFANPVLATIDSEGSVQIPYIPAQAGMDFAYLAQEWHDTQYPILPQMYCMAQYMYFDHYSSSSLPAYEFLVKPFSIPSFPYNLPAVQINELADGLIKVETDWDKFDKYIKEGFNYVHEPEFVIDVSAYDQSTAGGRLQAIVMAKLAVISLHYNLAYYGSLFRLNVEIKGLPADQSEFKKPGWTPAYAKTTSPYSGPSPLAQKYYQELLSSEFCPQDLKQAKSYRP